MKKLIFIPVLFLFFISSKGQHPAQVNILHADSIRSFKTVDKNTLLFIDSTDNTPISKIADAAFVPLIKFAERKKIPARLLGKTFYLRFTLQNGSNITRSYFYYPGKLYQKLILYKVIEGNKLSETNIGDIYSGFIPIEIPAGVTNEYIIKMTFFKNNYNEIDSKLINQDHLQIFTSELYQSLTDKKIIGIILSGMLLMMILVALLNYFITKKIEFLHNSLYSLCMLLIIFLSTYLTFNPSWFKGLFISYLDLLLLVLGTLFYLAFTRHFLDTRELHPRLNNFLKFEAWLVCILMILYSVFYFGFDTYMYEVFLENTIKVVLLIAALVYIFLSFVERNPLMNYLAIGVSAQIFFSIISFILGLIGAKSSHIFTSSLFYFELGVISSIIFFLLGLFYKNRQELIITIKEQEMLKLEVEKQSFQNQLSIYKAQQEERNRISADMHDELGAGMTSIRLYSELAKSKSGDNIMPEIEKISSSSDELINKMNAIIWSMSSQNDSLGNMVAYIRSYTIEYLENTGIKPIVSLPENLPALIVNGTIRRNIFLVIKEALQNIVKHSNASEVRITMLKELEGLSLTIHDNGIGIDFDNIRQFSNGLRNMRKRMKDLDIDFSIENNNGTLIKLYRKTR